MDQKRKKLTPETTKRKPKLSTPEPTSQPSNLHFICNKEVVIQLERLSDSVVAEMTAGGSTLPPEQAKKKLKLFTSKRKLHPSNPHFICDKEMVIQLERLNYSFVAEMTAGGSALPPEQVNESNDDTLDINSLPNEIISEVFAYLEQNQLAQIARVCRRWNVLTKSPVLWKKVDVKIFPSYRSKVIIVKSFINGPPSCVTSIRLDFVRYNSRTELLDYESLEFEVLCMKLQEKCPRLEELILIHSVLSNSLSSVIDLCIQFLQDVKNLIFYDSSFRSSHSTSKYFGISNIKILELNDCYLNPYSKSPFSKLPQLEQLHLYRTRVEDSWFFMDSASLLGQLHVLNVGCTYNLARRFQAIQRHGHNLKELYLCWSNLHDRDLTVTDSAFPHLKTICLSLNYVTCESVVSLIQSCPSLQNVFVDEDVAESFAAHPLVVANKCKSGIVEAIHQIHDHNVDYSHSQF